MLFTDPGTYTATATDSLSADAPLHPRRKNGMSRSRRTQHAPLRFCPAGTTGSGTPGLLRKPESFIYTPASGFASLILRSTVRPLQGRNIICSLPRDSLALIPRLSILRLLQSRSGMASMAGVCTLIICAGSIALGPLRWGYWECCAPRLRRGGATGRCCAPRLRRGGATGSTAPLASAALGLLGGAAPLASAALGLLGVPHPSPPPRWGYWEVLRWLRYAGWRAVLFVVSVLFVVFVLSVLFRLARAVWGH